MAEKFDYINDCDVIRIPDEVKAVLDKLKPNGVANWRYYGDVITIGLAIMEKLKENPELRGVMKYQVLDIMPPYFKGAVVKESSKA